MDARQKAKLQHVAVRAVGGWCRDKLLSLSPTDIDVCVDVMSGKEFSEKIAAFVPGALVNVVGRNTEQSKHLETAVLRLGAVGELDVAQLRCERYEDPNSRVPSYVGPAALQEDAVRRDCTFNAIYFCLESRTLLDPTQRGLRDLQDGLVRTPLPPREILRDDPLRLLRVVRFASMLGFRLDDELRRVMAEPEVLKDLSTKVTRERVWIEFEKMLLLPTDGFDRAMSELESVPQLLDVVMFPGFKWRAAALPFAVESSVKDPSWVIPVRLAALMLEHAKGLPHSMSQWKSQYQRRLTWSNDTMSRISQLLNAVLTLEKLIAGHGGADGFEVDVFQWARRVGEAAWEPALLLLRERNPSHATALDHVRGLILSDEGRKSFFAPLLNGEEVMAILRCKPGPDVGNALASLTDWQLRTPLKDLTKLNAEKFVSKMKRK